MNNEKYILILTLLFINKEDSLNNSYKLMRVLEWNFRTINSKKILEQIQEEQYAEYDIINGVHYYKLTLRGRELIKKEYNAGLEFLLQEYPKETNIITSLFNSLLPLLVFA